MQEPSLVHLVQKDKIWDHGSMVEFVKIVFYQLQKIRDADDQEIIKKFFTSAGYVKFRNKMEDLQMTGKKPTGKNSKLKEVSITEVKAATKKNSDSFKALVKGYEVYNPENWNTSAPSLRHDDIIREFSEQWTFVRQGEWWLLDEIIPNKYLQRFLNLLY